MLIIIVIYITDYALYVRGTLHEFFFLFNSQDNSVWLECFFSISQMRTEYYRLITQVRITRKLFSWMEIWNLSLCLSIPSCLSYICSRCINAIQTNHLWFMFTGFFRLSFVDIHCFQKCSFPVFLGFFNLLNRPELLLQK